MEWRVGRVSHGRTSSRKTSWSWPSTAARQGEAPKLAAKGPNRRGGAQHRKPGDTEHLMEEVCERENLKQALERVKANKGSPGVDGMTVKQLPGYLKRHWPQHREALLTGRTSRSR